MLTSLDAETGGTTWDFDSATQICFDATGLTPIYNVQDMITEYSDFDEICPQPQVARSEDPSGCYRSS
jgi:hypothetical protein